MVTDEQETGNEEELDLSSGMVPYHHLGQISGYDHDSGLPIVKRKTADAPAKQETKSGTKESEPEPSRPAASKTADSKGSDSGPKAGTDTTASPLQKGSPVLLPDGSTGKVAHVIDGMGTVRVRTDDGRNLTVRAKALKVQPHVVVQSHVRKLPQ